MNPPSDPVVPEPEDEALREIAAARVVLQALDTRLPEMEERIVERHKRSIFWWKAATGVALVAAMSGIGAAIYGISLGSRLDDNQVELDENQVKSDVNICNEGNEIRRGIQDVLLLATPSKNPDDLKPLQREAYDVFEPINCSIEEIRERAKRSGR